MKNASDEANRMARNSTVWLSGGVALAVILAGMLAWHTVRTILRPIQAMTHAALGISAGQLDQLVPYPSRDELGQLAQAFNTMAHRLRDYRESQTAKLLRAQQTAQATIDSFPDPVIVIDSEGGVEMANPAARRLLGVIPSAGGLRRWRSGNLRRLFVSRSLRRCKGNATIILKDLTAPSCSAPRGGSGPCCRAS